MNTFDNVKDGEIFILKEESSSDYRRDISARVGGCYMKVPAWSDENDWGNLIEVKVGPGGVLCHGDYKWLEDSLPYEVELLGNASIKEEWKCPECKGPDYMQAGRLMAYKFCVKCHHIDEEEVNASPCSCCSVHKEKGANRVGTFRQATWPWPPVDSPSRACICTDVILRDCPVHTLCSSICHKCDGATVFRIPARERHPRLWCPSCECWRSE